MVFAKNRFALHFKRYFLQFCKVKKTAHGVCGFYQSEVNQRDCSMFDFTIKGTVL